MDEKRNCPEIILSPDEEGRISASVGSFIQGDISETELLNLLRNLKTEKLAEIAKAENNISPAFPDAQQSSLLKESDEAVFQKSGIGKISGRFEASDAVSQSASVPSANTSPEASGVSGLSGNADSVEVQRESAVIR